MNEGHASRIIFSRFEEGEDVVEAIKKRVEEKNIKAGTFALIGALSEATLGCYKNGEYVTNRWRGHLEIVSCIGNIALDETGNTIIHAHMVISDEKGEAFGGHLMKETIVGPTAELTIIEAEGAGLRRSLDPRTKLKLLK